MTANNHLQIFDNPFKSLWLKLNHIIIRPAYFKNIKLRRLIFKVFDSATLLIG